jgi:hypothetical protein
VRHTVFEKGNLGLVVSVSLGRISEICCFGVNYVDVCVCIWVLDIIVVVLGRVSELKHIKIAKSRIDRHVFIGICQPEVFTFKDNLGSSIVVTGQLYQWAALIISVTTLFAVIEVDV